MCLFVCVFAVVVVAVVVVLVGGGVGIAVVVIVADVLAFSCYCRYSSKVFLNVYK